MSTRLHHGYRIRGDRDILDLADQLRDALTPVYHDRYRRTVARLACAHIDAVQSGAPVTPQVPLMFAVAFLDKAHMQITETRTRNPQLDFQCEVVFLSDPADRDWRYLLLYTDVPEYRETFEQVDRIVPWPYWNSTDRPDDITEDEWDLRRDTWQRVLNDEAAGARGLTFRLIGDMHAAAVTGVVNVGSGDTGSLVDYIPSREERARPAARESVTSRFTVDDDPKVIAAAVTLEATRIAATLPGITVEDLTTVPTPPGANP